MNAILKIAALATIFAAAAPAVATSANLFNTVEYRTNSLDALPQWQRALSKIEQEQKAYRDCAKNMNKCGSRAVQAWQAMIKGPARGEAARSAAGCQQLHQSVALPGRSRELWKKRLLGLPERVLQALR